MALNSNLPCPYILNGAEILTIFIQRVTRQHSSYFYLILLDLSSSLRANRIISWILCNGVRALTEPG